MSIGRYALGIASLVCVFVSLGAAAVTLRRDYLSGWLGAPARLAEAVLGLALLTGVLELLGLVGLFELGPIVLSSALVGAGSVAAARRRTRVRDTPPPERQSERPLLRAAALVVAGLVFAEWAVPTLHSYDVGIRLLDSLWYHLPWAATFAQTGHVTPLQFTDVEYLTAFYPAGAELLHGFGIVMLGRDTLSPGLNLAFLPLILLAGWCVGRPRGLGAATMCGAALVLALPVMRSSQAGSADNDMVGIFFLLAAVALLVTSPSATRGGPPAPRGGPSATDAASSLAVGEAAPLVLAALAGGLAIAVKLSLLAPVLALSVGALAIARPGRRRPVGVIWAAGIAVTGSFWYLRNLFSVGNPFPWTSFGILPTPVDPLQAHTAFSVLHYATDQTFWSHFLSPGLANGLGPLWPLVLTVALLGPLFCAVRGPDRPTRMLGLVALAALAAYVVTPGSAAGPSGAPAGFAFNLRYATPALALAVTVTPLGFWRTGRHAAELVTAPLVVMLLITLGQSHLWPSGYAGAAVAAGALAVMLVLLGRAAATRWTSAQRPRIALAGAACVLLATAGAALGYVGQRHYLRGRYRYAPHVSSLAALWQWFRGVHGARVGLVGTFGSFFSYPMFGLDGSNRVSYVAHRGPHGSFTVITSCPEWRSAVNRGHFDYLVTTPARDPWPPARLSASPEAGWTYRDPAVRAVFTSRGAGQTVTVFRLARALTPGRCPPAH